MKKDRLRTGFALRTVVNRIAHFSWAMADQAVVSGSNFLASIMLARILGLHEFGRYTLAWTALLLIQAIQHSAINNAMLTMGPKQNATKSASYYGVVFLQQGVFVTSVTVLTWIAATILAHSKPDWQLAGLVLPLSASVLTCLTQDFLRRYFYSIGRPLISLSIDIVRYFGQVGLFTFYFLQQLSADSSIALWIMAATSLIACLFGTAFVPRLELLRSEFKAIGVRKWHFSKWLIASSLLSWATSNLFYVAAGTLLGAATVGGMRAAQNIVGTTHLFFQGLENIVPREAARRLLKQGPRGVSSYLSRVAVKGGLGTVSIACIFAIFPDFWLGLLFGDAFRAYAYLVRLCAIYEVLTFFGFPLHAWLRTFELTRYIFYSQLCSVIVSVLIAYPLVAYFGATGALLGMLASLIVQLGVLILGVMRETSR
jgi:O-antigen/teichoic acid export membrane protein